VLIPQWLENPVQDSVKNSDENSGVSAETSGETSGELAKELAQAWDQHAPAPRRGGARLPIGRHPWNTGGKPGRSGRRRKDVTSPRQSWQALTDDEKRAEIMRLYDNDQHAPEIVELLRRGGAE